MSMGIGPFDLSIEIPPGPNDPRRAALRVWQAEARAAAMAAENAALKVLLAEGVPLMTEMSDELQDFQGMYCSCCRAVVYDCDDGKTLDEHHPDCWVAKVSCAVGLSIAEMANVSPIRPQLIWELTEGEINDDYPQVHD